MQIEMIQEWIEKVRMGLHRVDTRVARGEGGSIVGMKESGAEACGEGCGGSLVLAVISLKV